MTYDAPAVGSLRLERRGRVPAAAATSVAACIVDELGPVARAVRVDVDAVEIDIDSVDRAEARGCIAALLGSARLTGWRLRPGG